MAQLHLFGFYYSSNKQSYREDRENMMGGKGGGGSINHYTRLNTIVVKANINHVVFIQPS